MLNEKVTYRAIGLPPKQGALRTLYSGRTSTDDGQITITSFPVDFKLLAILVNRSIRAGMLSTTIATFILSISFPEIHSVITLSITLMSFTILSPKQVLNIAATLATVYESMMTEAGLTI